MSLIEQIILFCWTYIFPALVVLYLLIVFYEFLLYERKMKKRKSGWREVMEEINESDSIEEYHDFEKSIEQAKDNASCETRETVTLDKYPLKAASKFYEIVSNRRSVRKFSRKPVDIAIIKRCILAATTGPPRWAQTEPCSFCVVSDREVKEQIAELVESDNAKEYLYEVPHLVLIFEKTDGVLPNYNEISALMAAGILLCALQATGLSSLVTIPLSCGPALGKMLGRPSNERLLMLLPVGYAVDDWKKVETKRKSL